MAKWRCQLAWICILLSHLLPDSEKTRNTLAVVVLYVRVLEISLYGMPVYTHIQCPVPHMSARAIERLSRVCQFLLHVKIKCDKQMLGMSVPGRTQDCYIKTSIQGLDLFDYVYFG